MSNTNRLYESQARSEAYDADFGRVRSPQELAYGFVPADESISVHLAGTLEDRVASAPKRASEPNSDVPGLYLG